ncbi:bifunctional 2-polyprenyl-6-hydroxyphenol methylase/3-demethylubiquinol 3-O-methyltransferase UbiG [Homoserinimonas sp. OAct 916]|uniref:class I SAM-dependent methyltransferase n=1 Tax=Homoserinimonas sp. OAct 916 TaxID=2211450 RepID=UPI000DBE7A4E|nr:class I SAM-dependent methyltransferase [Homoserinimonas sp. OAct 916]
MAADSNNAIRPTWRDDPALTGDYGHPYHARLDPNKAIVELLGGHTVPEGARALDVGAGSGRHSIWLAQHGWKVTAVDSSPNQINRCLERAELAKLEIETQVADVRSWTPSLVLHGGGFDLILCAFVNLTDDFRRIAEWLKPGGELLIVLHGPESKVGPFDARPRPSLTELVDSVNPPLELLRAERRVFPEQDTQLILHAHSALTPGAPPLMG